MNNKLRSILVACLVVALLACTGCGNRTETSTETTGISVENVMQNHTIVEIGDVTDETAAEVIITTPNLAAIYMDLLSKSPDANMPSDEIAKAIAEYAENEEFLVASMVVTSLEKDGNDWKLTSDECISEVVREQVNNLMIQMINAIGTIEVEDIPEELK